MDYYEHVKRQQAADATEQRRKDRRDHPAQCLLGTLAGFAVMFGVPLFLLAEYFLTR